jgi:hypothetical protein
MESLLKLGFGIFLLGLGAFATREGWKEIRKGLR